jgi:hypothetical protein
MSENPQAAQPESLSEDKNRTIGPSKPNAAVATVALLAAPATALAALLAPAGSATAIVIACSILAVTGFLLNSSYGENRKPVAIGTGLLLAVAAATGGAVAVKSLQRLHVSHVLSPKTAPPLGISLARDQTVPWCTRMLTGTGNIPAGYALLIFDIEANANNQPSQGSEYSEVGQADPLGNGWSLDQAKIGVQAKKSYYVEVAGVLINKEIAAFLGAIKSPHGWATSKLPPAIESFHAFVLRNTDVAPCS